LSRGVVVSEIKIEDRGISGLYQTDLILSKIVDRIILGRR
jgi:hypothetical protein